MKLQCGEIASTPQLEALRPPPALDSIAVDTGCNGVTDTNGADNVENESDHGGSNHSSNDQWKPPGLDYKNKGKQKVRDPDRSHSERDFRPPSLILPDASNMESEFVTQQQQQQVAESDYRAPQSYLPASLVMSPHDARQNFLDPNAREFTPSPSPCPSPTPPGVVSIVQPPPPSYHLEPPHIPYGEIGHVVYSPDYSGGPVLPLYAPNGAPFFGPLAGSPTPPWENQHAISIGMQGGELSHHHHHHHISTGSGPLAPPPMVGQHPHIMRPYASAPALHSYLSSASCSPPIGSPTGSVSAFAVPPPLTGREHVSRALLLSGVPTELTDFSLKQELEQWGLVRALGLERRHEGLVTTHYYDLRHSKEALRDIQQQHLLQQQRMQQKFQQQMQRQQRSSSTGQNDGELDKQQQQDIFKEDASPPPAKGLIGGKAVWAQYTVPVGAAAGPDSHNQGTLVVFNLDVDMPLDDLRAAFEVYGPVKELRETPAKRQHKFVEFFDIRDAARALAALDGHEIGGKRVKIEFSRPGGQARRARAQAQAQAQQAHQGGCALVPFGNRLNAATTMPGQPMYVGWSADPSMGPPQSMAAPPPGLPQYLWANFQHVAGGPPMASLVQQQHPWNVAHGQLQPLPYQQIQQGGPGGPLGVPPGLVPIGSEHNRQQFGRGGFSGGPCSPGSTFHVGIGGFGRTTSGRLGCDDIPTGRRRRGGSGPSSSIGASSSLSKMDLSCLSNSLADISKQEGIAGSARDSPRSGKTGLTPKSSPREHAQYVFHVEQAEMNTESPRTTLMIKNIPNKYSQSMLLALLDQHCLCCNNNIVDTNEPQSGYDFVYLPIDFKNRCNLGYAFVNFTSVQATLKLYRAFHAQQWEAFNSRKICQVTYARVQGRAALEEHFRNSRFACDTDEYLPLIFSPPRTGIVCPPPVVAAGHLAGRPFLCSPLNDLQSSVSGDLESPHSGDMECAHSGECSHSGDLVECEKCDDPCEKCDDRDSSNAISDHDYEDMSVPSSSGPASGSEVVPSVLERTCSE